MSKRNGHAPVQVPMNVPVLGQRPAQPQLASMGNDPQRFEADFKPTGDYVLLRVLERKESAGGIQLPDGAKTDEPTRAQIVSFGPGRYNDFRGELVPLPALIKKDAVVYPLMASANSLGFKVGDEKYILIPAGNLLGFSSAPPEPLPAA